MDLDEMKSTFNIKHSRSNAQLTSCRQRWALSVECWALNVSRILLFACLGGGFAARSWASEPSDLSTGFTAPGSVSPTSTNADSAPPPRDRALAEADLLQLLTDTLQKDFVKDRGELELRLTRPWTTRTVPGGPLTIKILDMPAAGVSPSFILRFEIHSARGLVGSWQLPVQARVWRDIWVARSALRRGDALADADVTRERRDLLTLREQIADFIPGDATIELAEPLQAGSPLFARSIKARPVMRRGQMADAVVQDGTLSITMRVEVLEDGAPGQIIRARNSQSRRDVRGKVVNEQTILVLL